MQDLYGFLANHGQLMALLVMGLSFVCSMITAITPTPPPGSRFAPIYRVIEIAAGVFGYAKDHGLISPSADMTTAAGQALSLGREVVSTIKASPAAPPPTQIADDASEAMRSAVAVLREVGVLPPAPRPAGGNTPPGSMVGVFLAMAIGGTALFGLAACNEQTIKRVQAAAPVAAAIGATIADDVLPPSDVAKLKQTCAANAPALAVATDPAMPDALVATASYPASYCQQLDQAPAGRLPATTDAHTPSWLPGALTAAADVAKVAAIVLPLVL